MDAQVLHTDEQVVILVLHMKTQILCLYRVTQVSYYCYTEVFKYYKIVYSNI